MVSAQRVVNRTEFIQQDAQHRRAVFDVYIRIKACLPLRGLTAALAHLNPVERIRHELHQPLRADI